MNLPKLILTDIDGVWTDGGMYYDETGNEWKKFNTADSWGVAYCKHLKIKIAIITGESTNIVKRRSDKLKVDYCFMGAKNKVGVAEELRKELGLEWKDIAFIGDDINDIQLMKLVGIPGCPANAPEYIKREVKLITKKTGGEGAFREFVELLIGKETLEEIIPKL
jgi:3-deoxy-D-glycero-D-galacto-nononate 9-phosphatase